MIRRYLVFFALTLGAFAPLLFAPYLYDDVVTIETNQLLRSFSGLASIFSGHVDHLREMDGTYRPVFLSILSCLGRVSDFDPFFLRLVSFLLHALVGIAVWILAREILGFSHLISSFTALLFLLHPVQITNLALLWKQSDIWIALLGLGSIYALHRFSQTRRWIFWGLCLGLFVLAFGFKESAMILPLLCLAFEPIFSKEQRKARLALIALGCALSAFYYLVALRHVPGPMVTETNPASRLQYFFTELSVFPLYLSALIQPHLLSLDRHLPLAAPPTTGEMIFLSVFLFLSIATAIWLFRRSRVAFSSLLCALIWLAPTTSFQPLALLYDETRLYLFLPFLVLFLSSILSPWLVKIPLRPALRTTVLALSILLLLFLSLLQTQRWQSPQKLWSAVLEVDPTSARAYFNLGLLAQEAKALDEAEALYRNALYFSPTLHNARLNLGIVLGQKGDLDAAVAEFKELLSAKPYWQALGHYHLGLDALYRGKPQAALVRFAEIKRFASWTGLSHKGEAVVLSDLGRSREALSAWKTYLQTPYLSEEERKKAERSMKRLVSPSGIRYRSDAPNVLE